MNELPRNDVLKILKQQFLSGNLKEYDHKYDKTVAAWEKSRAAGAEAHTVRLSDDCRDLHVFDRIDDISKCHLAYFRDYYESRSTALERMGAQKASVIARKTLRKVYNKVGLVEKPS